MKRCWKCRKIAEYSTEGEWIHHIDGNHNNIHLVNKITLCFGCHDLIQGICDKCDKQPNCFRNQFQECWNFEDALPPIHFRSRQMVGIESDETEKQNDNNELEKNDPKNCDQNSSIISITCKICGKSPRLRGKEICQICLWKENKPTQESVGYNSRNCQEKCTAEEKIKQWCPFIGSKITYCHRQDNPIKNEQVGSLKEDH